MRGSVIRKPLLRNRILKALGIMHLIIFSNEDCLNVVMGLCESQSFSYPRAKQAVLKASPSTELSEMMVTAIRSFS